jgi:hypothetical protein
MKCGAAWCKDISETILAVGASVEQQSMKIVPKTVCRLKNSGAARFNITSSDGDDA